VASLEAVEDASNSGTEAETDLSVAPHPVASGRNLGTNEQHILDTNAGKQLSQAATDV
jgi:hypothetical protein